MDDQDTERFDITKAAKDEAQSTALTREEDIAQIQRKPKYLPVYLIHNEAGKLETLILPIYGHGLWSTLYGFIALEGFAHSQRAPVLSACGNTGIRRRSGQSALAYLVGR